ncbi:MAG: dihydrolipoyl dehydrogenase [Chloroflexi bacterium]|nr:dihydrolipoyl dehydrogenase [Chloroflexota bacterium]|tara:strand:+ start:3207 stop:4583 length:1377 start_codon:yes stop_codon:yes gene_type:complete
MSQYDVIVIGSGPAGYVASIRASQLGLKTLCIEKEAVGGVCLNWGCIPSKSLLKNAEVLNLLKRSEEFGIKVSEVTPDYSKGFQRSREVVNILTKGLRQLFKKNLIEYKEGTAYITSSNEVIVADQIFTAHNIIISTGARPKVPYKINIDGKIVMTSKEAILDETIPESVAIIGAGAIGVEFAYLYKSYGSQVTLVESMPQILPKEDSEVSNTLSRSFRKRGIHIYTSSHLSELVIEQNKGRITINTPEGQHNLLVDRILIATGISPNIENIGLENIEAQITDGFVAVDENLSVNKKNVYAIGDINGRIPLAHVAQAEGVFVAEHIAGLAPLRLDYDAMPRAVYCSPQIASIGLTEKEATERGYSVRVGKFPFMANGKSLTANEREGFAKIIGDAATGELLGAHLIGHEVTELLGELSLTRILDGTTSELGGLVKAHPSASEVIKEAALATQQSALHI